MNKTILDVACGSRMFWFNKYNPNALYLDIRKETHTLYDGRIIEITPDVIMNFRFLGFKDGSFKIIVFDPPHLKFGENSFMAKKYGILSDNWKNDLKEGFAECWRVLEDGGTLIFKWSEGDISVKEVLKIFNKQPLFGHTTGRSGKTKWMCFMKWMQLKS